MSTKTEIILDEAFTKLIPPLNETELAELERSILSEGIRDPLVIWEETNVLLDGHHRYQLAQKHNLPFQTTKISLPNREAAEEWIFANQLGRRNLTDNWRAYLLGKLYEAREKKQGQRSDLNTTSRKSCEKSWTCYEVAEKAKVSPRTVHYAAAFAQAVDTLDQLAPGFREKTLTEEGLTRKDTCTLAKIAQKDREKAAAIAKKITQNHAPSLADARRELKRESARQKLAEIAARDPGQLTNSYDVIVIDPPWPLTKIERDYYPEQVEWDYPTMSLEEIRALKLPAAENCHVFLWTTQKFLPHAFTILEAWGAHYICTFVWHKSGGFQPFGLPQFNAEFVLYGRIGSPTFITTQAFPTCFNAPRTGHSRKPDEFYEMIARTTAGRRLDMFAREPRQGFDIWGKEA